MAYQNVGTPRFYINCIEWMHSMGQVSSGGSFGMHKYFTTSASNPTYIDLDDGFNDTQLLPKFGDIPYNTIMGEKSFIAFLGHNLKSADCEILVQEGIPDYSGLQYMGKEVNCGSSNYIRPDYDGFSLTTGNLEYWQQTANSNQLRFESGVWEYVDDNPYGGLGGVTIGAIVVGNYYDMPH